MANAPLAVRCMAFRQRSSVDLPATEGPISAVTAFGSTARLMSGMIVRCPNPAVRLTMSMRRATFAPRGFARCCNRLGQRTVAVLLPLAVGASIRSGLSGVLIC